MNKLLKFKYLFLTAVMTMAIQTQVLAFNPAYLNPSVTEKFDNFKSEFNITVNGFLGFFLASSICIFTIHFIRLGAVGGRPEAKQQVLHHMFITGICTAGLSAVLLVYNMMLLLATG